MAEIIQFAPYLAKKLAREGKNIPDIIKETLCEEDYLDILDGLKDVNVWNGLDDDLKTIGWAVADEVHYHH